MTDDDYEDITGSTKAENILFLTDPLLIFESDVPTTAIYEEEQTSKSCLPELYLPVPLYLQDHACLQALPLFRNKRFALNEMFQRNASKFAIFYV